MTNQYMRYLYACQDYHLNSYSSEFQEKKTKSFRGYHIFKNMSLKKTEIFVSKKTSVGCIW